MGHGALPWICVPLVCLLSLVRHSYADEELHPHKLADDLYWQALSAMREKNDASAVSLLEEAAAIDPDSPRPVLALARLYQKQCDDDASQCVVAGRYFDQLADVEQMTEVVDIDKHSIGNYYHGLLHLKVGDTEEAVRLLNVAIDECANCIDLAGACNSLGLAYYYDGKYEDATNYFRLAISHNQRRDLYQYNLWSVTRRLFLYNYVANLANDTDDYLLAVEHVKKLRELAPHYTGAREVQAQVLLRSGRNQEAFDAYAEIVRASPKAPETFRVRLKMARIAAELGRKDEAVMLLAMNISLFPDADWREKAELIKIMESLQELPPTSGEGLHTALEPDSSAHLPRGNPSGSHGEMQCSSCHPDEPARMEPLDCDECHSNEMIIHPTGMKPGRELPDLFPLSASGELLCRSCHFIHGGKRELSYLRVSDTFMTEERSDFCAKCHGIDLKMRNPHSGALGDDRCRLCHTKFRIRDRQITTPNHVCNFCHGKKALGHPQNVYFFEKNKDDLPFGDGLPPSTWSCSVCHDPHGSMTTTHLLRKNIAIFIERKRAEDPHLPLNSSCRYCHRLENAAEIRFAENHALRYGGDVGFMCMACHLQDRGHHPMGIRLDIENIGRLENPPRLTTDNRIDCYTCHDNGCDAERYTIELRAESPDVSRADLCWSCHNKDSYIRKTPHVDEKRYCLYCHENPPLEGNDILSSVHDVPDQVCINCHEVKPHPLGPHMVMPSRRVVIPEEFPLGEDGSIICPTCHSPHYKENQPEKRLRIAGDALCYACHGEM